MSISPIPPHPLTVAKTPSSSTQRSPSQDTKVYKAYGGAITKPKSLFDPPYDWEYRDKDGNSIFHLAIETQPFDVCALMVRECPIQQQLLNRFGRSPHDLAKERVLDLKNNRERLRHNFAMVQIMGELAIGRLRNQQMAIDIDFPEAERILTLFQPPKVTQSSVQQNPVTRVMMPSSSTRPGLPQDTKVPQESVIAKAYGEAIPTPKSLLDPPHNMDEDQPLCLHLGGKHPGHIARERVLILKGRLWEALQEQLYAPESIYNTGILPDYLSAIRQVQQELEEAQNISAPFPPPMALSPSNPRGENLTNAAHQRLLSAKGELWEHLGKLYAPASNDNTVNLQDYLSTKRQLQKKKFEAVQSYCALFLSQLNLTSQPLQSTNPMPRAEPPCSSPPSSHALVTKNSEPIALRLNPAAPFEPPYDLDGTDEKQNWLLHLAASEATFQQCEAILKASPIQGLMPNSDGKCPIDLAKERAKSLNSRLITTQSGMNMHEEFIGIKNLTGNRYLEHPIYAMLVRQKNDLEKKEIPEAEQIVTLLQPPSYLECPDDADY